MFEVAMVTAQLDVQVDVDASEVRVKGEQEEKVGRNSQPLKQS